MNKKISIAIIILIILIILTLGILLVYKAQETSKEEGQDNTIEEIKKEEVKILEITEAKKVYQLEMLINYYIDDVMIAEEESQESDSPMKVEEVKILEELGITTNEKILLQNAYILEANEKNTLYFVKGNLISKNLSESAEKIKREIILTITIDKENKTFDILPYKQEFSDIIKYQDEILESKIIDIKEFQRIKKDIEENYFNSYSEIEVTDEEIANRYYQDYQINALYFPEDAYEMIDAAYKKERFPSFEKYQIYLNDTKEFIKESTLTQYGVDKIGEYMQYTLVDSMQNSYFVKTSTTSPMNYKILLDNYTIKTAGFEEKYNRLSDRQKVVANAHIFIQMLNTRDYEHAYGVLADSFKNNNFKTLQDFENYARNHLLRINKEVNSSINQEGKNFVYHLELQDNNESKQNMTIVMQLKKETDFVMAFSIEE